MEPSGGQVFGPENALHLATAIYRRYRATSRCGCLQLLRISFQNEVSCEERLSPHPRRTSSVCRTPYIPPTRLRREPERPPCPPSDRPGVDLGFGSSFDYLPAAEAVLACTSIVASCARSQPCTWHLHGSIPRTEIPMGRGLTSRLEARPASLPRPAPKSSARTGRWAWKPSTPDRRFARPPRRSPLGRTRRHLPPSRRPTPVHRHPCRPGPVADTP